MLSFEGGILSLNADVWVDAEEFERLCVGSSSEALQQALALYQGDLLPETLYDDWTQPRRDALQRLQRETVYGWRRIVGMAVITTPPSPSWCRC